MIQIVAKSIKVGCSLKLTHDRLSSSMSFEYFLSFMHDERAQVDIDIVVHSPQGPLGATNFK